MLMIGIIGSYFLISSHIKSHDIDNKMESLGEIVQVVRMNSGHYSRTRRKFFTSISASITCEIKLPSGEKSTEYIQVSEDTYLTAKAYFDEYGKLKPGKTFKVRHVNVGEDYYVAENDKLSNFNESLGWLLLLIPLGLGGGIVLFSRA
jgi:hypothetical protein